MINKILGSIFSPKETFQSEIKNANWSTALLLHFVAFLAYLFSAFIVYATNFELARTFGSFAFYVLIVGLISMWIFSFVSKKIGGKGNFLQLYYLSALWVLPFTLFVIFLSFFDLGIISTVLLVAVYVWELTIFFIAVREITKLPPKKTVIALIGSGILLFVFVVLLVALLVILINPAPIA